MKKYNIRTEQPRDFKIVENLTREAFWNVYRSCNGGAFCPPPLQERPKLHPGTLACHGS